MDDFKKTLEKAADGLWRSFFVPTLLITKYQGLTEEIDSDSKEGIKGMQEFVDNFINKLKKFKAYKFK